MITRKFLPGSEWLYLKVYTGVKTADIILVEIINHLVVDLKKKGLIKKWFFIRYRDPLPHLRIRFLLKNPSLNNEVLASTNAAFAELVDSHEISNILIDSYDREVERYGQTTMQYVESLFWKNSEFVLQCLDLSDEEKIMIVMYLIDNVLKNLGLESKEKITWISESNDAFKKEFNADKTLNKQLDKKFRIFKPKFLDYIQSKKTKPITLYLKQEEKLLEKMLQVHKNNKLQVPLKSLFLSIFHMNINRMFVSNQRQYEMVIYDHLLRHYKSHLRTTIYDY